MLILILAYVVNAKLIDNVNQEGGSVFTCSGIILLVIFFSFLGGNITWFVFQYKRFGGDGCGTNVTFITITLVIGILTHVIVLFRPRPDASVLTSSIVLAYFLYLEWNGMSSSPDKACNPYTQKSPGNTTFEITLGIFFNFFSLLVIAGSTQKDDDKTLTNDLASGMMENEQEAAVQP